MMQRSPPATTATYASTASTTRTRRKARRKAADDFSSYVSFGNAGTVCLGLFLALYLGVMVCILPMLAGPGSGAEDVDEHHHDALRRGASFDRVRGRDTVVRAAGVVRDRFGRFKEQAVALQHEAAARHHGVDQAEVERHQDLLADAKAEWEEQRKHNRRQAAKEKERAGDLHEREHAAHELFAGDTRRIGVDAPLRGAAENPAAKGGGAADQHKEGERKLDTAHRYGFVVLGMHRSGTSMLSGLLVSGMGYKVGEPLIGAAFDNEKGFFERIDVVLQNDEFFKYQNMWWGANVVHYDPEKALKDRDRGLVKFEEGERALKFLNDGSNAPWLQKDPRMCITLRTWVKLLDREPAVVFTYRHPLEVAMSLKKREANFSLEHGLRLWLVYNMRAVQNMAGMCTVLSSNDAVLADPLGEVQRIADELTNKCVVPSPERSRITQEVVDEFVDPSLQHNKKKRESDDQKQKVLEDFGSGCVARDFASDLREGTSQREEEVSMYLRTMRVFCDFKSGKAYKEDYEWPEVAPNAGLRGKGVRQ